MRNTHDIAQMSDAALPGILEQTSREILHLPQSQIDLIDRGDESMVGAAGRDFLIVFREAISRGINMHPELRSDVAAQLAVIRVMLRHKTPNLLRSLEPQMNLIRDRDRGLRDNRLYRQRQAQLNLVKCVSMVHPDDVERLKKFSEGLLRERGISIPKLPVGRKPKQPAPPEMKRPRGRPRKDSYAEIVDGFGISDSDAVDTYIAQQQVTQKPLASGRDV